MDLSRLLLSDSCRLRLLDVGGRAALALVLATTALQTAVGVAHDSLRNAMTSGRWLAVIVLFGAALRFVPIWFGLPFHARPDETVALGLANSVRGDATSIRISSTGPL